jgi:transcriptional regulator with XRE-family HTH domain
MEDLAVQSSIGQRIRSLRKARGIRSTAELAALIPGDLLSGTVLRNIEAGAKPDLAVSELLNIAHALGVAPVLLLAPVRNPDAELDLPNLSDEVASMTAIEFDGWLSGSLDSAYQWMSVDDQSERSQLQAMRELELHAREHHRLSRLLDLTNHPDQIGTSTAAPDLVDSLARRRDDTALLVLKLSKYLESAGWNVQRWTPTVKSWDTDGSPS